jgi:hypothetical protein
MNLSINLSMSSYVLKMPFGFKLIIGIAAGLFPLFARFLFEIFTVENVPFAAAGRDGAR